jgi:hypothetical protein
VFVFVVEEVEGGGGGEEEGEEEEERGCLISSSHGRVVVIAVETCTDDGVSKFVSRDGMKAMPRAAADE